MSAKKIIFLCCLVFAAPVFAQPDSLRSFQFPPHESFNTKLEHAGFVLGASLAFSFVDYIGFNMTRYNSSASKIVFRSLQIMLQGGLSYFLYKQCGLNSAIAFNLIWWTWGDDFGFYGWAYTTRIYPWEDNRGISHEGISWAGWTPIGLLRAHGSSISRSALIAQGILGFAISIAIL
jgi:hypothetical protein